MTETPLSVSILKNEENVLGAIALKDWVLIIWACDANNYHCLHMIFKKTPAKQLPVETLE